MIRWNPGTDLMNLHSEMDRLFDEVMGGMGLHRAQRGGGAIAQAAFLPLDIERTDDALIIRASVPGFKPEEVNVTVDRGILTIDAQKRQEEEQKERNFVRQERFIGRLYRQIVLGQDVRSEDARATFADGVLTVTVPLAKRAEPRRIPVEPGEGASAQAGNGVAAQAAETSSAQGVESIPVQAGEGG
jgi:HSP20 family protein